MAKKRVNELAKQFNLPSQEIVKRLEKAGITVKAAASAVDEDTAVAAIPGKPLPNGNGKAAASRRPQIQTGPGLGRPLGTGDGPARPSKPVTPSARRAQEQKEREQQQREGTNQRGGGPQRGTNRQRPQRGPAPGGPGGPGGVRRVVIDSQASRRGPGGPGGPGGGPGPGPQRRPGRGGGRRRRRYVDEEPAPLNAGAQTAAQDVIRINSGSTVKDVAEYLQISAAEIIKKLMQMGE